MNSPTLSERKGISKTFLRSQEEFFKFSESNGGLLSVGLAAQVLQVTRNAVVGSMEAGRLSVFYFSGALYVSGLEVRAWAERRGIIPASRQHERGGAL